MLDLISNQSRILVAKARRIAQSGDLSSAVEKIETELAAASLPPLDVAALLLTEAELFHLNGEFSRSYSIFEDRITPILSSLPHAVGLTIELNRVELASSLFHSPGISRFYGLVDEMRIAGLEHWDASSLLHAYRQRNSGKSYDSLPAIWRELNRTYQQGRWNAFRDVSRYMAEECLRIGDFGDAAFHVVVSENEDVAKELIASISLTRTDQQVRSVLEKLFDTANLASHFRLACIVVQGCAEFIPDEYIDRLITWILPRCCGQSPHQDFGAVERSAWKTLSKIASRCSPETAEFVVEMGLKHPSWSIIPQQANQMIRGREEVVDAIFAAVSTIPPESLGGLVEAAIPLAVERRSSVDFNNVVDLFAHIFSRASESVRTAIKAALYPSGQSLSPVLIQLAPHFGVTIGNQNDQLEKYAQTVTENLYNVVQRVKVVDDAVPVNGTVMTWTSQKEHETLLVHSVNCSDVYAITRNRKQFSGSAIAALVAALVDGVKDIENLLQNKIVFIDCILGFADVLSEKTATYVFDGLAPIAEGTIESSTRLPCDEHQNHPLSRMRMNSTTPSQVTGHALFALARIERHLQGTFGKKLQPIVEVALVSESPEIRKNAFAAVREMSSISESTWMPLIMGTRDPDPIAASLAFDAIAHKKGARLTRSQWGMVLYALRTAHSCSSIALRRAAANAIVTLAKNSPNKKCLAEINGIRALFAQDMAFSVRLAALSGIASL